MLPNWVFIASLGCLIALFVVGVWMQATVKRRLKNHYASNPDVPDVTFNPLDHSASRTLSFFRFIASKRYSHLNDAKLTRDCNALRVLYACYLAVFIWVIFAVLVRP